MLSRREFIDTLAIGAAGLAIQSTAKSYGQIIGANERVNFAVIGLHGRGFAHLASLKANASTARISHICDVESNFLQKFSGAAQRELGYSPATEQDFRKVLESKDVDAISIATPDHWHAPMAIAGMQAGKHVYLEKPCSHNPGEGELLVRAQQKYGKLVQMGVQRRSAPHIIEIVGKIHGGLIGRPYLAKAWYSNTRKSIGFGKDAAVPATLNWDLWQGPAPRMPYKDNYQPYNWHWFRIYGTGEALNNGTHEVDVCRWALGVDLPNRITAFGGRYAYKDDWQFYDTMSTSFEYEDKLITWDSTSCQGMKEYNRDRGSVILGTTGSVFVDGDGYEVFDLQGKKTSEYSSGSVTSSADTTGHDSMTNLHFANFIAAVRSGEKLNAPVADANVSVTMLQLSNIAWEVSRILKIDAKSGHILDNPEAMKLWSREYEKGWEPRV